jgi:3-hydroxyisobutyrate dehydrogenase-like beta-hydroxyacid dehydrogenase
VKALNNLMAAGHILMAAEAVRLIKRNNIDPDKFFEAISNGSGNSRQFQLGFAKMVAEDFTPSFSLGLMRKDVNLAMELAEGTSSLFRTGAKTIRSRMEYADEDFYAVYKLL